MSRSRPLAAALIAVALLGGACGRSGTPSTGGGAGDGSSGDAAVDETVEIGMVDVSFEPTAVSVRAGTSVRFVFRNEGVLPHQAYFGDEAAQQAYATGKAKPVGVAVGPGRTKSFVYRFETPGPVLIGCHVPGHWQAGMKARLNVV